MINVEGILRGSIADNKEALEALKRGGGCPPWSTEDERQKAIKNAEEVIAREEAVLNGGKAAIAEWWDGLPEQTRQQLANA